MFLIIDTLMINILFYHHNVILVFLLFILILMPYIKKKLIHLTRDCKRYNNVMTITLYLIKKTVQICKRYYNRKR